MHAVDCIEKGFGINEVVEVVQSTIPKVRTEFIIDTVEYLHKGGRCSGLQMLLSSMLEIHPIIKVTNGSMHLAAKVRGNRQAVLNRLVKDALGAIDTIDCSRVFITHADSDDDAVRIKAELEGLNRIKQLTVTGASCVISSHCGPKTIGIIYLEK
jgi:DegV family protein with EDD domain